jgi:hypothetical protein
MLRPMRQNEEHNMLPKTRHFIVRKMQLGRLIKVNFAKNSKDERRIGHWPLWLQSEEIATPPPAADGSQRQICGDVAHLS